MLSLRNIFPKYECQYAPIVTGSSILLTNPESAVKKIHIYRRERGHRSRRVQYDKLEIKLRRPRLRSRGFNRIQDILSLSGTEILRYFHIPDSTVKGVLEKRLARKVFDRIEKGTKISTASKTSLVDKAIKHRQTASTRANKL